MAPTDRKTTTPTAKNPTVSTTETPSSTNETHDAVPVQALTPSHDKVFGDSGTGQLNDETALRNAMNSHS